MARRSKIVSGILMSGALVLTSLGLAGVAMSADPAAGAPASTAGSTTVHTGHVMAASTLASPEDPDGDGYIPANPPVTGVVPSKAEPTHRYFHEFQANCSVSHTRPDDPIVYPGQPGKSHDHTFMGNTTTNAASTTASLDSGRTTCRAPGDKSAYWMPTLLKGNTPVLPVGPQVIYYKAGVTDYTSVRSFPKGLRFVVGSPCSRRPTSATTAASWRAGSAATASSTSTSRSSVRTGPTSSSTSASRRPVAGTASTWTPPTTRATWRIRWSIPARTTTSARTITPSPCR